MKTQTITRENLKAIHDVACSGWKFKLASYASRNPFGNDIELTQLEVDKMYIASDSKQKLVLGKYLTQPKGIKDRVKGFESACEVLGINPKDVYASNDDKTVIAFKKLIIIIKALNEGWTPNWEDSDEYKYYNYFQMKGGFSHFSVGCNFSKSSTPSVLYLKSEDLAKHAYDIAKDEYENYYK